MREALTIAFDGKRAANNSTGLGNYSRYVINLLLKYYPENHYVVFLTKSNKNKQFQNIIDNNSNIEIVLPQNSIWKKLSSLWRVFGIKKEISQFDDVVYHGLSNELPLTINKTNAKSVVTIHDLIFLKFPQYYKFFDRKIYAYKFRKACENADKIVAVSECTKKDIIEIFKIKPEKIDVIYQGCDKVFKEKVSDEILIRVKTKYDLPNRFLLNVGTIEERKNALLIVKALPSLKDCLPLVIVGKRTKYALEIEENAERLGVKNYVRIIDNVPFEDLAAFYHLAEIFIYPSRYEGFGIPIIEAINCGIPVIAAKGSCLEEAGGENCLYVNPDDEKQLADAITQFMDSPDNYEVRKTAIEKSKMYVEKFSEKKQAEQLMKCYHSVYKNERQNISCD